MYSVYSKNMKKDVGGNQVIYPAVSQEIRIRLYGHKGEVMCDFNGKQILRFCSTRYYRKINFRYEYCYWWLTHYINRNRSVF